MMADTESILIERYQHNPLIPLQLVADDYLPDIKWETLKERARAQELPFPVVVSKDKRPTYHVNVRALAAWIDRVSEEAAKDHLSMHA
ncbi:pyocin activator PrtN family protein [Psychrobacter celer]|uniref:pyocin activator PrtN family protein n=1 Tax=Psychrobacter celer TaxID=306572 RepID=UPI003FD1E6E3